MSENINCMVRIDNSWRSWYHISLLGVILNITVKRQSQLCTEQTDGIVKGYGFPGDGKMYPIVEYFCEWELLQNKEKILSN